MLLLSALFALNAGQISSDRLTELAGFAAVSELCRDLGYTVVDDFGSQFERRVVSEAAAQGMDEGELHELLAPRLESFVGESVAQMESSLAALQHEGNLAPLSSLLAGRDTVCFRMTTDALTAGLISAGSEKEREAARDARIRAIADRIR